MKYAWLVSRPAYTVFRYCSWIVVAAGILMTFAVTPWFGQIQSAPAANSLLRLLGAALGIAGAPAALVVLAGMALFCILVDRSSFGKKSLWFICFLSTACFGAAVYFFVVYKKQVAAISLPT
jgi:hypothetical protein